MGRTILGQKIGDIVVAVHQGETPMLEWQHFIATIEPWMETRKGLILLFGTRLTYKQRADFRRIFSSCPGKLAALFDRATVQGTVAALEVLGVPVKAFGASEVAKALSYLGSTAPCNLVESRLSQLTDELAQGTVT